MSWIKLENEEPPHEVVLASCDSYDCGWVIDTAWWSKDENSWMTTGGIISEKAHLPYTHWKLLPEPPKEKTKWN